MRPNVYRAWQLACLGTEVGRGAVENPVRTRVSLYGSGLTGRVRRNLHREGVTPIYGQSWYTFAPLLSNWGM
jgi:hypothetical protein